MPINFPNSPSIGDIHPHNDKTWKWNGTSWVSAVGDITENSSQVFVQDTAPSNPSNGDLWWDSDEGSLKIYYEDVDSAQWIETSPAGSGGNTPLTEVNTKSEPFTITANDHGSYIRTNYPINTSLVVSLPDDATENIPIGTKVIIGRNSDGDVTFSPLGGAIIQTPYTSTTLKIASKYDKVAVLKTSSNTWEIEGNLSGSLTEYGGDSVYVVHSQNSVDEDGGKITFTISQPHGTFNEGQAIEFLITEDSAADNIQSVLYNDSQQNLGKSGTITVPAGNSSLEVTMKIDFSVHYGNTFDITFSETGSKFKLHTDSVFSSDSVTKTINVNEFSPVDYRVISDSIQVSESSEIDVTIEATNLSDIINVSRTLNLSVDSDRVSIPSTVDITTISAGEHSGSFTITVLDDDFIYPNEVFTLTITDPINPNSTFLVNPDSENEAPVVGTGGLGLVLIDNDSVAEYTISSNVNTVDDDDIYFEISSNVRDGRNVDFLITEDSGSDNIGNVYVPHFYEDFINNFDSWEHLGGWNGQYQNIAGNHKDWITNVNAFSSQFGSVYIKTSDDTYTTEPLSGGVIRFQQSYAVENYAQTPLTHSTFGTQTNRVRINVPYCNALSIVYLQIIKDGSDLLVDTNWFYTVSADASGFGSVSQGDDGNYRGYLEFDYTDDIDPNSSYILRIWHRSPSNTGSSWALLYISNITVYDVSQGNLGKSGTIDISASDGSSKLLIEMENDSASPETSFDVTFSETGSEFKLDTDSDFTSDSVTKTINISE